MVEPNRIAAGYTLGHSAQETERLISQANIIESWLGQLFEGAGLTSGMVVLDIGCGAGDVSLLARRHVGETGRVVGVDNNPTSLARARERVTEAGLDNVHFMEADLNLPVALDIEFDFIVGRRILTYLPDRARLLKALLPYLRPGGTMAFQEVDTDDPQSGLQQRSAAMRRIAEWVRQTMVANGTEPQMGSLLGRLLVECGLEHVEVHLATPSIHGKLIFENQIGVARSTLPMALQRGFVTPDEAARFEDDVEEMIRDIETGVRTATSYPNFNAWGRKPK